MIMAMSGVREYGSQLAMDTCGRVSWPWTHVKCKAHLREMIMALSGDRERESQLAVDTYKKQISLEGDVDGAVRGSRGGQLVGRGHI